MTIPPYALRLRADVSAAERDLARIDELASAARPAPNAWSPREVIGHLIDSACNNHGRFVRAAIGDDLVFPGYAQEAWVDTQAYGQAPWPQLIALWASYNRHLARVMATIPDDVRAKPRARHNLHEISWNPVPQNEPATLDYFMNDYVGHLEHHLRQVLGAGWEPS